MSRRLRQIVGRALIGVMLLAQLAVAAYACPNLGLALQPAPFSAGLAAADQDAAAPDGAMTDMADITAGGSMVDCDRMAASLDEAAPNLCAEHCRVGQQSDQTPAATVPAVVLSSLYPMPALPAAAAAARPGTAADGPPAMAAAPPLAILHCRFRD